MWTSPGWMLSTHGRARGASLALRSPWRLHGRTHGRLVSVSGGRYRKYYLICLLNSINRYIGLAAGSAGFCLSLSLSL